MNILITGASGFLGSKILRKYIDEGIESHAIGRRPVQGVKSFRSIDILDARALTDAVAEIQPSHILHLASKGVTRDESTLGDLLLNNTVGTDNVLSAAASLRQKPQVFMLGTAYEYASSKRPLHETSQIQPGSAYAISKTASSHCMSRYSSELSMHFLRLFNVYGPGEPKERLIPYIVQAAKAGQPIALTGCEQIRDFIYIDDLVAAIVGIGKNSSREPGANFLNVGTGHPSTLKDVVVSADSALKARGIEAKIMFGALPYRRDDPMFCVADNSKLASIIGPMHFRGINLGVPATVDQLL
jgi:nucleoside-diphosphate-sugar epimerase